MYEVDLKDVIKNYDLRAEEGFLFCLLEAISNALYCSIENSNIQITVKITRQYAANEIIKDENNYIQSLKIEDNGTGFTDDNFRNFTRQIYKTNHTGGKGLGRVAFLKIFNDVKIESIFKEESKTFKRTFSFNTETIEDNKSQVETNNENKTTITFKNIKPEFQEHTQKNIDFYRNEILKHFYIFLYYLKSNNKQFEIKLIDNCGSETEQIINTDQLNKDTLVKEKFVIEDKTKLQDIDNMVDFELWHIKTKNTNENKAFYVVDERSAGEINNIDLPPGVLEDKSGVSYYYNAYLKSRFFSRFLNESRTKLTLPKNKTNLDSITEEKIQETIKTKINLFLKYELEILNKKKENRIIDLLNNEDNNKTANNKAYSYILTDKENKEKLLNTIKFNDSPQKILSKIRNLHKKIQTETIQKIDQTIQKIKNVKTDVDFKELENEIKNQIQQVNIENIVNLSSYIMYRKYILNIFNEGLESCKKNKIQNEAFFHNILLPKNSNNSTESNLWLIDDQLLYFEGMSDVAIEDIKINGNKIIRDLTKEERDMLAEFNKKRLQNKIDLLFFPEEKKCIIIELKDPKVGLNENVFQMDRYVLLLANFAKLESSIESFFTYLITDNFNKYDKPGNGYRKIYGIDGFVRNSADVKSYENDSIIANQYSEVIRYTDIYKRANKRNRIFFEKMNLK
ncbi:MAG: ATP-binding protein [Planctomycetaceae bacterium]|jgi:hypothetical protein|nr:ATP-binding protein [Planctomycetaceae bacterium]